MKTATATNIHMGEVYALPRGGYLVETIEGYIQVGSPPETIKDTMGFPQGVPQVFCLPNKFFNRDKAISVAEVEFPLYYNFFIKKRKFIIVCLKKHKQIFQRVIREALFGPENVDVSKDFAPDTTLPIPNMKKELAYFVGFKLEEVVQFYTLDNENSVKVKNCVISLNSKQEYEILDLGTNKSVTIPPEITYNVIYDIGKIPQEPFKPPVLGVTCLGPSHGFDPKDNTSGFIIWINEMGIMVDPPVNSTEWLMRSNVNPKLIDAIILTHTHADHDTGTFQKILEEEKIDIYTTHTVMDSWINKYSTLSEIPPGELRSLFNFKPVTIGESINIKGAWFQFRYMLHSIPTVGFNFSFRNKTFVYSSDHLNLPDKFDELLEKNIISKKRYQELSNFPWHSDIIYHESGMPPLHTPVSYLNSLPVETQKKMTIYHIAAKDFPSETTLTLAKFGIANTRITNMARGPFQEAYSILDTISKIDLFKDFDFVKIKDTLSVIERKTFKAGAIVIKKGTPGDYFYIVESGSLAILREQKNPPKDTPLANSIEKDLSTSSTVKRYGRYQYVGEVSLLLNEPRTVDVYAETDVTLLAIEKTSFLNIIKGTESEERLKNIALNRDQQSWEALSCTPFFNTLTASQKTELETLLKRVEVKSDMYLFQDKKIVRELYIHHSGNVEGFNKHKAETIHYKTGDIIGNYKEFKDSLKSSLICQASSKAILFKIEKDNFDRYLKRNPGVYLRFFEALS
ncbi:hypothetical protein COTS27_00650 [Spirochaetota bacterium]|nr:hypothetical protein COTS27_00650 [Spirochaetota bacterium]